MAVRHDITQPGKGRGTQQLAVELHEPRVVNVRPAGIEALAADGRLDACHGAVAVPAQLTARAGDVRSAVDLCTTVQEGARLTSRRPA